MGSHRKPRTGLLERPAARRGAIGVGAAALVSATLLSQSAHADDPDGGAASLEEQRERAEAAAERAAHVRDEVDRLYREAGVATQRYNEAREEADEQQERVDRLLEAAAEATEDVNEARRALGAFAAAQYRHGGGGMPPTATLLLATDPQAYFSQSHALERLGERQQQALADFTVRQREAEERSEEASEALTELEEREAELQRQKEIVQNKLANAQALLDQLSEEEEAAYQELERLEREEAERRAREAQERREREQQQEQQQDAGQDAGGGAADGSYASLADQAIAFAEAQLGKPYVWGATGPDSYDCSGLTQAAWRAAGVEIPRVTWDQVTIGTQVTRDQLQPGDLVFFYDDISHVGLYVGDGQMIHAPKPGDVVKYESIDVMPIHSYVRPA